MSFVRHIFTSAFLLPNLTHFREKKIGFKSALEFFFFTLQVIEYKLEEQEENHYYFKIVLNSKFYIRFSTFLHFLLYPEANHAI